LRLAIAASVSLLALVGLGGCNTTASADLADRPATYAATLTVTDADAIGTKGDARLSLAEAIALANGSLDLATLSDAERGRIDGAPGAESRDQIKFDVVGGAVRFPLQVQKKPEMDFAVLTSSSLAPALIGNDGDAILGGGIRFTNGPDDATDTLNSPRLFTGAPLGGTGLVVQSSNFVIEGVTFERFILSLSFLPAAKSAGLENVKLINNRFHNTGGVIFGAVSAAGERSVLRKILVRDNEFLGPTLFGEHFPSKFHTAVSLVGATANVAASAAQGAVVLEDLEVTGNTIKEFAGGVQSQPLQTLFAPNSGARLTGLKITGNTISLVPDAPDPAIYLWGAVSVGGQVSNVRVSDILVQDNTVAGNGFVIFVVGAEALLAGSKTASDVEVDNIRILGNRVGPRSSCSRGITTIGAYPEMNGPNAIGAKLSNVVVSGNTVEGCTIGALATPVLNVGAPGVSSGNAIEGLVYDGNRFTGGETGILVAGGALTAAKFDGVAGVDANSVSGVRVLNNHFDVTKTGVLIAGGFVDGDAKGGVSNNRVGILEIGRNTRAAGNAAPICQISNNVVRGEAGTASGNSVVGDPGSCERAPD